MTAARRSTINLTDVQVEIGKAITELRLKAGYESSAESAEKFNLPVVQYWRIENGKANLTLKSIHKILTIHNIGFIEFFQLIGKS